MRNEMSFKVQYTEDPAGTPSGRVWIDYKVDVSRSDALKAWNSVRFAGHEDVLAVRILSGPTVAAFAGVGEVPFNSLR